MPCCWRHKLADEAQGCVDGVGCAIVRHSVDAEKRVLPLRILAQAVAWIGLTGERNLPRCAVERIRLRPAGSARHAAELHVNVGVCGVLEVYPSVQRAERPDLC